MNLLGGVVGSDLGGEGVGAGARRCVSCVGRVEEEGEHQMGIHGCIVIKAPLNATRTLDERSSFGLFREEGRGGEGVGTYGGGRQALR